MEILHKLTYPTEKSGLLTIRDILNDIEEIKFIDLDSFDVVRHPRSKNY